MKNLTSIGSLQPLLGYAFFVVVGCYIILTLPILWAGGSGGYDYDESHYHVPAIRQIHQKWPELNLREDSLSATAPGYHYLLASISMMTGDKIKTLRVVNWLVSLGVLLAIFLCARSRIPGPNVCWLLLPLVTSNFYIKSACWVVTDNAALLLVTLAIITIVFPIAKASHKTIILTGILIALATFTRQMCIWLVIPMLVQAMMNPKRLGNGLYICLGAMIPLLVLFKLYAAWGGLVPEIWRGTSVRLSLCPIAYILSVFAIFGVFYLPFSESGCVIKWLSCRAIQIGFGIGFIVAVSTPTAYDYSQGRWGGYLWEIAGRLPVFAGRSLLFAVLAPVGAGVIAVLWTEMRGMNLRREAVIWLSAVMAWSGSFVVNRQVFQRYYEPMVLVFLIFAMVQIWHHKPGGFDRRSVLRLAGLTVMQVVITFATVYRTTFI